MQTWILTLIAQFTHCSDIILGWGWGDLSAYEDIHCATKVTLDQTPARKYFVLFKSVQSLMESWQNSYLHASSTKSNGAMIEQLIVCQQYKAQCSHGRIVISTLAEQHLVEPWQNSQYAGSTKPSRALQNSYQYTNSTKSIEAMVECANSTKSSWAMVEQLLVHQLTKKVIPSYDRLLLSDHYIKG